MFALALLILSFVFFALVIAAMTVGLWFGRKPIKGTCGGLANMQGESCSICGKKPGDHTSDTRPGQATELL